MNISYTFKPFIDVKKINWTELCKNPSAIEFIEQLEDLIDWLSFAKNPNCYNLIKRYKDEGKIPSVLDIEYNFANEIFDSRYTVYKFYNNLSKNPNIEIFMEFIKPILEQYFEIYKMIQEKKGDEYLNKKKLEKINKAVNMTCIFANPHAIECIKQYINFNEFTIKEKDNILQNEEDEFQEFNHPIIDCDGLIENPDPEVIELLENNNIIWNFQIMKNPNAINIIKRRLNFYKNKLIEYERTQTQEDEEKYQDYIEKLDDFFKELILIPRQEAVDLILEYYENDIDKIINDNIEIIYSFASNPFGLQIIKDILKNKKIKGYVKRIIYIELSKNPNPEALKLIFNENTNSIKKDASFVEKEIYKNLSSNPSIFEEHKINLK